MSASLPTSHSPFNDIFHCFNVEFLGEGDFGAGANVLAAKCISLANLHPPGTCLICPEGNRLPVGMSFITAGGLTNSLVSDKVLDPIAVIQNNLGDHLSADAAHASCKLAAMTPIERDRSRPKAPETDSSIGDVRLCVDSNGLAPARNSSPFEYLLGPSRHQGLGEISATPAVFLSADSANGLEKQLSQSHQRYPYVRASLSDGPGTERLEGLLLSVVRGTISISLRPLATYAP